tara:strand:+ start:868 stop:1104 length:237 start_codon:yes stop_codon:yes gene_type:complete
MDLKEQFEKETGNDPWFEDDKTGLMGLTQDYVDWLETKLENNEVLDLVSSSLEMPMREAYYDEVRKVWITRPKKDNES